ncbi:MAG: hypothetical protein GY758_22390 [Fuerstiella sp.]|jgi:hypothetical protein|nr:hypothetical protein [Fuerstiella sp.]MCP4509846.1 hypothetical protein [Fuerstiella sp.]
MEAHEERDLLRVCKQLSKQHLRTPDEPRFVPPSKIGSELLFDVISRPMSDKA